MPDIEKIGSEAKKTVKRVASDSPLSKPAGMAVAGAALAAIPYAVDKLGSLARPKISEKASERRRQGDFEAEGSGIRRHAELPGRDARREPAEGDVRRWR